MMLSRHLKSSSLTNYLRLKGRIMQQRNEWNQLLENLGDDDLAVIMDCSESYECKYNREVQGMHLRGSHKKFLCVLAECVERCRSVILHGF